jgi:long-chain acyl-CoA synthetase
MNLAHWLDRAGRALPDAPAVALGGAVTASYAGLRRRCAGLAATLRERHGLEPGDRVAIVAKNHPAYLEALLGTWWAGLTAVPVNAKLHPAEIGWILEHAQARAVLVSDDLEAAVGGLPLPGVRALMALGDPAYERAVGEEPAALTSREPNDLAWLFYTSGTTGRPKGAMLTHRNLMAMSLAHLTDLEPVAPGDALLHAAPMSHGSGLLSIPYVCRAALNVVPESGRFEPAEVFELIGRHHGASLFAAPTMVRRLVDCPEEVDTDAIRTIVYGGAPMLVPDNVAALDRLGPCLAQLYGQGETPMTITALSKEDVADRDHPRWLERLASAGVARSPVELRVAGEDGGPLPDGQAGEVLVRGDTVMRGYWRDEDATAATLRDGWLHTGDVGTLDEAGYLTLKDRSKDLIISGGSNIYPREVEEALIAHPGVREVSVIGRPDAEWGEVVVAYVSGDAGADELDALCLEQIARFKRPKDYVFVPSLPKSNYGKVLKTELRALDEARARGATG